MGTEKEKGHLSEHDREAAEAGRKRHTQAETDRDRNTEVNLCKSGMRS